MDLKKMAPKDVDKILAGLWEREQSLRAEIARLTDALNRTTNFRHLEPETRLATAKVAAAKIRTEAEPFEAEYSRRPWRRYFLVTNGNGHVHRGMSCSTCFPSTSYGWLTDLSGCVEKAMVAEYGEKACTVCFPDAPSMYAMLGGKARIEREQDDRRAARDAKRADATAKKAAKAITNPDGSVLKGQSWRIDTVSAAWRELTDITETLGAKRYAEGSYVAAHIEEYKAAAERIAAALAHKTGRTIAEIKTETQAKAQRRGK